MTMILRLHELFLNAIKQLDVVALPALRIYLAAVFWVAGMNKVNGFDQVVEWFGNPDWGLGLPFPWLMAFLATASEVAGAVLLTLGLATRYISVPLMITMLVAVFSVHWPYGWQAVADLQSAGATDATQEAITRLQRAREILQEHGNYDWLTDSGRYSFVVSNNGIEWGVTYFLMLAVLAFSGGGRWFSADYWIAKHFVRSADRV
ncbi:HvfX family Cu-binding RiPP maturation protein [Thalassolituus marinus]|uniref:DoxX family protein n=1 Tax=Thalassolituus marinus TaxID=671053 RepID=A0ABS7ZLF9_9GAMM|nr:DoxX family protein [Thalassolituus marinus]MCA6062556.1 DoxX family protein [Thalassolituus marinus]